MKQREGSKKNNKYASLKHGSIVLIKEYKKLVAYFGYPELAQFGGELIEMYDLENDSEELHDLALEDKALAGEMLDEFKKHLIFIKKKKRIRSWQWIWKIWRICYPVGKKKVMADFLPMKHLTA